MVKLDPWKVIFTVTVVTFKMIVNSIKDYTLIEIISLLDDLLIISSGKIYVCHLSIFRPKQSILVFVLSPSQMFLNTIFTLL